MCQPVCPSASRRRAAGARRRADTAVTSRPARRRHRPHHPRRLAHTHRSQSVMVEFGDIAMVCSGQSVPRAHEPDRQARGNGTALLQARQPVRAGSYNVTQQTRGTLHREHTRMLGSSHAAPLQRRARAPQRRHNARDCIVVRQDGRLRPLHQRVAAPWSQHLDHAPEGVVRDDDERAGAPQRAHQRQSALHDSGRVRVRWLRRLPTA